MSELIKQLREASKGREEWRVADPATGSYCISFSRDDSCNPERAAQEWLADHRRRFPMGAHSGKEVQRTVVQDSADLLMNEAADTIEQQAPSIPADARSAALRAKVEECRENDARRYRWLRDKAAPSDWEMIGRLDEGQTDAAIDAAIAAEPQ